MEKEVEREAGQDLQIGLDPGEGLEAEGKVYRELNHYGGC